jgi:hypothetical protein
VSRWHRVFGTADAEPDRAALVGELRGLFPQDSTVRFRGDDQGWYAAEVLSPGAPEPWRLDRYLSTEEGIRHELNNWAAWLETVEDNPNHGWLMRHLVSTRQVFTFELEIGGLDKRATINAWCHRLCRILAGETAGVYQIDNEGFFAADGTLMLRET